MFTSGPKNDLFAEAQEPMNGKFKECTPLRPGNKGPASD